MGMAGIFTVDDVHKTYEELVSKGVEFTEEPTERFYGTDCGLRDPFGNPLRIGTPKNGPIEVPDPRSSRPRTRPEQRHGPKEPASAGLFRCRSQLGLDR